MCQPSGGVDVDGQVREEPSQEQPRQYSIRGSTESGPRREDSAGSNDAKGASKMGINKWSTGTATAVVSTRMRAVWVDF